MVLISQRKSRALFDARTSMHPGRAGLHLSKGRLRGGFRSGEYQPGERRIFDQEDVPRQYRGPRSERAQRGFLEQVQGVRAGNRLRAALNAQLAVDMIDMALSG